MSDFTTLLNRGHKRYIDKYLKRRNFGKCEGCEKLTLLMEYKELEGSTNVCNGIKSTGESDWKVCEFCYTELINNEEE